MVKNKKPIHLITDLVISLIQPRFFEVAIFKGILQFTKLDPFQNKILQKDIYKDIPGIF